jgi:hypothetical protein
MNLQNAAAAKTSLTLTGRLRMLVWTRISLRRGSPTILDPRLLPDRMLKDLGLRRPSGAWEESVGFWRDR